jgi:hypothetical protein
MKHEILFMENRGMRNGTASAAGTDQSLAPGFKKREQRQRIVFHAGAVAAALLVLFFVHAMPVLAQTGPVVLQPNEQQTDLMLDSGSSIRTLRMEALRHPARLSAPTREAIPCGFFRKPTIAIPRNG